MSAKISKVVQARVAFLGSIFAVLELLCRIGIIDRVTMIPPSEMVAVATRRAVFIVQQTF